MEFQVEGAEDAQITLELEPETEYDIKVNGVDAGQMKTKPWRQAESERRVGYEQLCPGKGHKIIAAFLEPCPMWRGFSFSCLDAVKIDGKS